MFCRLLTPSDWDHCIEVNRAALLRIVVSLFAMIGLTAEVSLDRIPYVFRLRILRVLRPAEFAVRRLIFAMARGITVEPAPERPKQQGKAGVPKGTDGKKKRPQFKLSDKRPPFSMPATSDTLAGPNPQNRAGSYGTRIANQKKPRSNQMDEDGFVDAASITKRLFGIKDALEDLPRQVQRLLRWKARRERQFMTRFVYTSPLRIVLPPCYRKKSRNEAEEILKECQWLASEAKKIDSS